MRKAVLDTNILVSALWTPRGNPARILALMPLGKIIPCYNYQIIEEYRAVLERPKLKFSESKTGELLRDIERYGISVVSETSAVSLPNESDRKFYDTAKICGAFLITGNIKHYPREPFIVSPAEFLARDKA
jgi:putative PIN family toxin of toxin-antitoxin system